MIGDAFYDSGMKYGNYLVPMWTFASRRLFNWGAPSLREAARYTAEADWESAFRIWKQLSFSADSTIAAKACTNLAVYYELEDRLDSAKFWLNRGLALDSIPWIVEYREELFVRLENQSEIQNQVN